jgi:acyl carrier protein
MPDITEKLKETMSLVFELPKEQINETSGPDDIDNWDSIGAINLVTALEDQFDIEFEEEDLMEMLNFQLIKIKIEEKLSVS